MRTYKCTHCGATKQTDYPPVPIDYHHKACSDAGYYNTMEEVPDRVRLQEEARGWHRALEREDYHDDRDNQDLPREWEHDRRLRGQYE